MGLLGNESAYSNRLILVYPKPENGVRIQAKLGSKNPTGLTVGVVSRENGITVDDGLHEIFVNAAVDDGSNIAELMWCFKQKDLNNLKFNTIKEVHRFYCIEQ